VIGTLTAGRDDSGRRLDRVLRRALPDLPLSLIHRLFRQGKVLLDGAAARPRAKVREGSEIRVGAERKAKVSRSPSRAIASPPPLPPVLARGSGVVVFNKPSGLASQGPGSLDSAVKAAHDAKTLSGSGSASLSFRPGPLHRLDRNTSGIVAFSENLDGARLFTRLLREGRMTKTYLAILDGRIPHREEILWKDSLYRDGAARKTVVGDGVGGRPKTEARTRIAVLAVGKRHTLARAVIETGRTHQIRAQAAARGHPLAGDSKYGGSVLADGFFLHAWKLEFDTGIAGLPGTVVAPPPEAFAETAARLFPDSGRLFIGTGGTDNAPR